MKLPDKSFDHIYDALCARFPDARRDRRGNVFIPCPWCGKEGQHFSFSPRGGHCFVCGRGGSLRRVAEQVGLRDDLPAPPPVARPEPRFPVPPWLAEGASFVARSLVHPRRLAAWAAYKPLAPETLDKHKFGLAPMPFFRSGRWYSSDVCWLTVPLYDPPGKSGWPGPLTGLRGRNPDPAGKPKWISAAGTRHVLWNLAGVRQNGVVWICENYVDAAWLMERHPDQDAVALGGAANWRDQWAEALAAREPYLVVVALDNDLAGQATGELYRRLAEARRAAGKPEIEPNGPRIATSLVRAGLRVQMFPWPAEAPEHADVGWLMANEVE